MLELSTGPARGRGPSTAGTDGPRSASPARRTIGRMSTLDPRPRVDDIDPDLLHVVAALCDALPVTDRATLHAYLDAGPHTPYLDGHHLEAVLYAAAHDLDVLAAARPTQTTDQHPHDCPRFTPMDPASTDGAPTAPTDAAAADTAPADADSALARAATAVALALDELAVAGTIADDPFAGMMAHRQGLTVLHHLDQAGVTDHPHDPHDPHDEPGPLEPDATDRYRAILHRAVHRLRGAYQLIATDPRCRDDQDLVDAALTIRDMLAALDTELDTHPGH